MRYDRVDSENLSLTSSWTPTHTSTHINSYTHTIYTNTINSSGTLASNGNKFDASRDRGRPFQFKIGVGQVIKGWDEGVAQMSLGEKAMLRITSDYGYGARGAGGVIPPNADLNFEVELLAINGKSKLILILYNMYTKRLERRNEVLFVICVHPLPVSFFYVCMLFLESPNYTDSSSSRCSIL